MACDYNILQAITQEEIGASKVAIIIVREVEDPGESGRAVQPALKTSRQTLRQPAFDWKA